MELATGHWPLATGHWPLATGHWVGGRAIYHEGGIAPLRQRDYFYLMIKPRLVFVVDDDSSARSGIARLLRTAGHGVRAFASAEEFLDDFDPETFGCLVLDVRMPGMSGQELQAELVARGVRLPIIVVSADDDPETRRAFIMRIK